MLTEVLAVLYLDLFLEDPVERPVVGKLLRRVSVIEFCVNGTPDPCDYRSQGGSPSVSSDNTPLANGCFETGEVPGYCSCRCEAEKLVLFEHERSS